MGLYILLSLKFPIARLHETPKFSQSDWSRPALCDRPRGKRTRVPIPHWTNFYTWRCACPLDRESKDRRFESHQEHCVFNFFQKNCVFFSIFNGDDVKNFVKSKINVFPFLFPGLNVFVPYARRRLGRSRLVHSTQEYSTFLYRFILSRCNAKM